MLLHFLLQEWLNTRKEGEKSLNDMQGNVNLAGQAIIGSLLYQGGLEGDTTKSL